MPFTRGDPPVWSEVQTLYTTLSSIRTTHGKTALATPSGVGAGTQMLATTISTLNDSAADAHTETHLVGKAYTTLTNPTAGTLISANFMTTLRTNIMNMNGVSHCQCQCNCNCDSCGCSGFCEGFG